MSMHRVFIAVNFPENTKRRLLDLQQQFSHLPIRFTKRNSLHVTIVFIGYVDDDELARLCNFVKEFGLLHAPCMLEFRKVVYGPRFESPRMIWVEGEKSEALHVLVRGLQDGIEKLHIRGFRRERRDFTLHITLGRIRMEEWRALEKKPCIEEDIHISLPVYTIDLMESELKRDGAEYFIVCSAELTGET